MQIWTALSIQKKICKLVLHEEAEIPVAPLKKGKSTGVGNIAEKLIPAGTYTMFDVLTDLRKGEWPAQ